jgi:hypothetical protein
MHRKGKNMLDLFNHQQNVDTFHWIVAIFQGNGATDVIKRASDVPLRVYYPFRLNMNGEPVPLWRNYLFIEFQEILTLNICRSTTKFLKIISTHDDEGTLRPILVRKSAIDENLKLLHQGKFNDIVYKRRFYGRGSLVRVIDGVFADKRVRLESDITPNMPGNKAISVSIGNWSGKIEIFKLAL